MKTLLLECCPTSTPVVIHNTRCRRTEERATSSNGRRGFSEGTIFNLWLSRINEEWQRREAGV